MAVHATHSQRSADRYTSRKGLLPVDSDEDDCAIQTVACGVYISRAVQHKDIGY